MKKYIIIALCIMSSLAATEQPDGMRICHTYDTLRASIFLHLLEKNKIDTEGIVILHPECATGVLSAKLAEKADRVRGFDQSENAIHFARATYNRKNLSFKHRHPEEFTTPRLFNLVVMDHYIDYIEDKQDLFDRIHDCLPSNNGELFITITTSDNEPHPKIIAAQQMVPRLQRIIDYLDEDQIFNLMIEQYPSLNYIYNMLENSGFEITSSETYSDFLPVTEIELRQFYIPILTGLTITEYIPEDSQETFITQFFESYLVQLKRDQDNKLLEPMLTTTIHARKIKK
jgi:trans-aconitate methyltransferase